MKRLPHGAALAAVRALPAALALAAAAAGANAGALEECRARSGQDAGRELTSCLNAARRAAADDMLEQFLTVERALAEHGGRGGAPALKQSQRDFERYLQSHCQLPLQLALPGALAPAQLACETDLLRDRAAQLTRLLPPPKPAEAAPARQP